MGTLCKDAVYPLPIEPGHLQASLPSSLATKCRSKATAVVSVCSSLWSTALILLLLLILSCSGVPVIGAAVRIH